MKSLYLYLVAPCVFAVFLGLLSALLFDSYILWWNPITRFIIIFSIIIYPVIVGTAVFNYIGYSWMDSACVF
jgi:hypothetical protein